MKNWLQLIILLSFHCISIAQVTISGNVKSKTNKASIPYVNVTLKNIKDSSFVTGGITNENGHFTLNNIKSGEYILNANFVGYVANSQSILVGTLSQYLDIGTIELVEDEKTLKEIEISAKQDEVSEKMDKKTFTLADNVTQSGGTVLQAIKNLPGVSVEGGKVTIRGNGKVAFLIDGKQTALSGFDNQANLDNIPASAIEKIEIINNPSAKYDANGNAGIINIIYKKTSQEGFYGKAGIAGGLGALWVKKENLPSIRPQYQNTPKVNPSLTLNYKKKKINLFFQGDYMYTETLNKNEFVDRYYDSITIHQQTKRNRNTTFSTAKFGIDWNINDDNIFTLSSLVGQDQIIDNGDQPFFNNDYTERYRLWQFLEDELKTTATSSALYLHKFKQAGHTLNVGYNFTFKRENERYYFKNIMPDFTGNDAFKVLTDEIVSDINVDYVKPLRYGRFETGAKYRKRFISNNMKFIPGINSPLDTGAGGWANYIEDIPALYSTYVYESKKIELEGGLRYEYVKVDYNVNPNHNTYKSDGYTYSQPFPNLRLAYKLNNKNKVSLFYNRRVDRPSESDIRIFPKYDDVEILKVGNPAVKPQFTNSFELAYKTTWNTGYFYTALYHKITDGTITRISTVVPGSTIVYNTMQNAGLSYNSGIEITTTQTLKKWLTLNVNGNIYQNTIKAFTTESKYPVPQIFTITKREMISGNLKVNLNCRIKNGWDVQLTSIYLAPDLISQGTIAQRYSVDLGIKKSIQKGKGDVYLNATDLFNTMVTKKEIQGNGFRYISANYNETQVIRIGYNYKF